MTTKITFPFLTGRSIQTFLREQSIADLHKAIQTIYTELDSKRQQLAGVQMSIRRGGISLDEMSKLVTMRLALEALIEVDQQSVTMLEQRTSSLAINLNNRNTDLYRVSRERGRFALLLNEVIIPRVTEARAEIERVEEMERGAENQLSSIEETIRTKTETGPEMVPELRSLQQIRDSVRGTIGQVIVPRLKAARPNLADSEKARIAIETILLTLDAVKAWVSGASVDVPPGTQTLSVLEEQMETATRALNEVIGWADSQGVIFPRTLGDMF